MAETTRRTLLAAAMGVGMAAGEQRVAWDFSFPSIDGGTLDLAEFKGRALLVVNTASFCGYTNQYAGLQTLHETVGSRGLTVVGVPSQDFNQESADNATVKTFCETNFGIGFPMTGLAHVRGAAAAPFYAWIREQARWEPSWNFNKVLIGRDGRIAGTFGSGDTPQGPKLTAAIEAALG